VAPPAPPPTRDRPARRRTDATLGLREAADRLGVHYMTAYRYVRSGRLPATKVGDEWRVAEADLALLRPGPVSAGAGASAAGSPAGAAVPRHRPARMCARLVAGDEAGAWGLVESALAAGVAPQDVLTHDLVPALREIGEQWAAGNLSIAEEHRASTVATRLVARLGPALGGPGRRRGTIVVGSVAGDHHALPTAILGDLLRGARFEVVDLGADTPTESFVEAATGADRLVAVALSVTAPAALGAVPPAVEAVRAALPDVPVLVGGGAVADADAATALGSDAWAAGPADVVVLFESLARERFG
jgi:excisionase family DNA binding protein